MKSHCVRKRKQTDSVPGSERVITTMISRFISAEKGSGLEELLFKAGAKGLYNLGRIGATVSP